MSADSWLTIMATALSSPSQIEGLKSESTSTRKPQTITVVAIQIARPTVAWVRRTASAGSGVPRCSARWRHAYWMDASMPTPMEIDAIITVTRSSGMPAQPIVPSVTMVGSTCVTTTIVETTNARNSITTIRKTAPMTQKNDDRCVSSRVSSMFW